MPDSSELSLPTHPPWRQPGHRSGAAGPSTPPSTHLLEMTLRCSSCRSKVAKGQAAAHGHVTGGRAAAEQGR